MSNVINQKNFCLLVFSEVTEYVKKMLSESMANDGDLQRACHGLSK